MKLTPEERQTVSDIRHRIAQSKSHNTWRGFIDWKGCVQVCDELADILEDARKYMEDGQYLLAYTITGVVLINAARLASSADDSYGGVTFVKNRVDNLLDEICTSSEVVLNPELADAILSKSCKDALNKAFDGCNYYSYDILLRTARLATKDNVQKIYDTLDQVETNYLASYADEAAKYHWNVDGDWSFEKQSDCLVRITATRASEGKEAADKLINANLQYMEVRKIAVKQAVEVKDFSRAEALCKEELQNWEGFTTYNSEWSKILFDVYEKSGNRKGQMTIARNQLIHARNTEYYDILKKLYMEEGIWEQEYPGLLQILSTSLYPEIYMSILEEEGEDKLLIKQVTKNPHETFRYAETLVQKYPDEVYKACCEDIREQAKEAGPKKKYRKICSLIKRLYDLGGKEEALRLLEELREKYYRRPTMMEELDACEYRLKNPGKRSGRRK